MSISQKYKYFDRKRRGRNRRLSVPILSVLWPFLINAWIMTPLLSFHPLSQAGVESFIMICSEEWMLWLKKTHTTGFKNSICDAFRLAGLGIPWDRASIILPAFQIFQTIWIVVSSQTGGTSYCFTGGCESFSWNSLLAWLSIVQGSEKDQEC